MNNISLNEGKKKLYNQVVETGSTLVKRVSSSVQKVLNDIEKTDDMIELSEFLSIDLNLDIEKILKEIEKVFDLNYLKKKIIKVNEDDYFCRLPAEISKISVSDKGVALADDFQVLSVLERKKFEIFFTYNKILGKVTCLDLDLEYLTVATDKGYLQIFQTVSQERSYNLVCDISVEKPICYLRLVKGYLFTCQNDNTVFYGKIDEWISRSQKCLDFDLSLFPECEGSYPQIDIVEASDDGKYIALGLKTMRLIFVYQVIIDGQRDISFNYVRDFNSYFSLHEVKFFNQKVVFSDVEGNVNIRDIIDSAEVNNTKEMINKSDLKNEDFCITENYVILKLQKQSLYQIAVVDIKIFMFSNTQKIFIMNCENYEFSQINLIIDTYPLFIFKNYLNEACIIGNFGNVYRYSKQDNLELVKVDKKIDVCCIYSTKPYLFLGCANGDILIYSNDFMFVKTLNYHQNKIKLIKHVENSLFSFAENSFLVEWSLSDLKQVKSFKNFPDFSLVSINTTFVVFARYDGYFLIYDLREDTQKMYKFGSNLFGLSSIENLAIFAAGLSNGSIVICNSSGKREYVLSTDSKNLLFLEMVNLDTVIYGFNDNCLGIWCFSNSLHNTLRLRNIENIQLAYFCKDIYYFFSNTPTLLRLNLKDFSEEVLDLGTNIILTLYTDSQYIYSIDNYKNLRLYNGSANSIEIHNTNLNALFSGHIVYGLLNGTLLIISNSTSKIVFSHKLDNGIMYLHSDNKEIWAGCKNIAVRIFLQRQKFEIEKFIRKEDIPKLEKNKYNKLMSMF